MKLGECLQSVLVFSLFIIFVWTEVVNPKWFRVASRREDVLNYCSGEPWLLKMSSMLPSYVAPLKWKAIHASVCCATSWKPSSCGWIRSALHTYFWLRRTGGFLLRSNSLPWGICMPSRQNSLWQGIVIMQCQAKILQRWEKFSQLGEVMWSDWVYPYSLAVTKNGWWMVGHTHMHGDMFFGGLTEHM